MNKSLKAFLCVAATLFSFSFISAQNLVFQMVTMTPKDGALKDLTAAMKAHNDTYHPNGDYGARVYTLNSGPDAGKIMWTLGPTTWTKLENRPGAGAHDDHWDEKVMQYIESTEDVEYYTFDTKRSHFPKDFDLKNLLVRYVDIKPYQMHRYNTLLDKVREVYTAKMPEQAYGIYKNQLGDSKDGRDVMIVWFFDNLSWMDEDSEFPKKYDEVHGTGSYATFTRELQDIVLSRNDILVSHADGMGGSGKRIVVAQRQSN